MLENEISISSSSSESSCSFPSNNDPDDPGEISDQIPEDISEVLTDSAIIEEPRSSAGMREKLREWALKHQANVAHVAVSDLLVLLREEGFSTLPKTAQTLLQTEHCRILQDMPSMKNGEIIMGQFIYLSIQKGLEKIIDPNVYVEDKISILVHVDGMQVYNNSSQQIWPIAIKVYHENYITKPFLAGIYCGEGKPSFVELFLKDFVEEVNCLVIDGIELHGKKYLIKIMAVIADAPARAFLKCCKPPGAFFACERCVTKGMSVGEKRYKKRIYNEMYCDKRTKQSFQEKSNPEHHSQNSISPLMRISNFDVIQCVVLEIMHLFYFGCMKWLAEKWILRTSPVRIKLAQVKALKTIMDALTSNVPSEFQRNHFDVNHVLKWKATQFKFLLNYCGSVVFKNILPKEYYKHFLLFVVASRILNDKKLVLTQCDYAEYLLRKFFVLLPSLYGPECQVLSLHNLIHVVDDARKFQIPLNDLSAFWGENYIGHFKNFVKSHNKPLTQIVNRLCEQEAGERRFLRKKYLLNDWTIEKSPEILGEWITVRKVEMYEVLLKAKSPDNVIQLTNEEIFLITKIWMKRRTPKLTNNIKNIRFEGYRESERKNVFNRPTPSTDIGIIEIEKFNSRIETIEATNFRSKCAFLQLNYKKYPIVLLHSIN